MHEQKLRENRFILGTEFKIYEDCADKYYLFNYKVIHGSLMCWTGNVYRALLHGN